MAEIEIIDSELSEALMECCVGKQARDAAIAFAVAITGIALILEREGKGLVFLDAVTGLADGMWQVRIRADGEEAD
jgi:hypothetical protein